MWWKARRGSKTAVESEIKLRITDPSAARERLLRIGAVVKAPRHFEDNLLLDDAKESLRGQGRVLRLRRTPAGGVLTFKGPRAVEGGIRHREELEARTPDPDTLESVLSLLGFAPTFRYQKYRESFTFGGVEIVLDETPIGDFLEVEGPPSEIEKAATALGFSREDYVSDSYAALFFRGGGTGDMVFR